MIPDNNWKESRILCEDLESLLGVPTKTSENFLKIVENLIVHKFLEEVLKNGTPEECSYSIEIPYIGTLVINTKGKKIFTDFVVRNSFYNKLKKAYLKGDSPLIEDCSEVLGKSLVNSFEEGDVLPHDK